MDIFISSEQVLKSSWGKPRSINKTITAGMIHEQWIYNQDEYFYFNNGVLTAVQVLNSPAK